MSLVLENCWLVGDLCRLAVKLVFFWLPYVACVGKLLAGWCFMSLGFETCLFLVALCRLCWKIVVTRTHNFKK